ncbi:MAG: adenylosuccinate synthase [Candidatus Latescibacteria bacterium]|nr:adenylosuccinate synthase [Candidatus Latescibacterota bacterium]
MPTKVVLGAQWGDEGKAKVVDYLTMGADLVVRYQGGANAGHTVKVGDTTFVFHMIPSGIMHPGTVCVVGNGVVVDPEALLQEADELQTKGISTAGRLFISHHAHVVMPYHKLLDQLAEVGRGSDKIGTTGRGIGPCYRDKVERGQGVRVVDMLDPEHLRQRLQVVITAKNELLRRLYDHAPLEAAPIIESYLGYAERLRPYIADTSLLLNEALDQGKTVLCEGAQGTLLDIDHGTYPFVTSSNTTAGGACTGTGIGPTRIDQIIGVTKAYTTRVGNGPFPTELLDQTGERIREVGHEYGATTGRSRRCGWFDAPILRLSARINGLTSLALTRLDVLDTFPQLKLCTGYQLEDRVLNDFPLDPRALEKCVPIYEEVEGWNTPTTEVRRFGDLPAPARHYVERIAQLSRTPISLISVGPERDSTIEV